MCNFMSVHDQHARDMQGQWPNYRMLREPFKKKEFKPHYLRIALAIRYISMYPSKISQLMSSIYIYIKRKSVPPSFTNM